MKDLYNNIEAVSILDPIAIDDTAEHTDIDLQGFNSFCLLISVGLDADFSGTNKLTFKLEHSDDGETYAEVETDDMLDLTVSDGVILLVDHVDEDNTLYKRGYVGGKRYLQLTYTEGGAVDVPMSIVLIKGHPELAAV